VKEGVEVSTHAFAIAWIAQSMKGLNRDLAALRASGEALRGSSEPSDQAALQALEHEAIERLNTYRALARQIAMLCRTTKGDEPWIRSQ
jgi:hypothetical protein